MTDHDRAHPLLSALVAAGLTLALGGCSGRPARPPADEDRRDESHPDDAHPTGVVSLGAEKAASAGLETVTARLEILPAQLSTTGQVDFNQDRLAHVSPRIAGRVHTVRATLGQQVGRGEVLAMLDSIELGRAKADYLQSKARERLTRENFEREERLFADRISSEREMLAAEAAYITAEAERRGAGETLRLYGLAAAEIAAVTYDNPGRSLYPIRAPLSGKVVEKHVTVGELVTPERNLFSLADLSDVWVWIDVYERDLAQVHVGDGVRLTVDAFPELDFSGTVSYLSDRVDADTRRLRARIDVANPERRLRPGMFAQVELTDPHGRDETEAGAPSLVVPAEALQRDGERITVFVALGEGRYRRQVVETGRRAGGLVEVTRGLAAGDVVVAAGAFFLKSELAKDELGGGHAH